MVCGHPFGIPPREFSQQGIISDTLIRNPHIHTCVYYWDALDQLSRRKTLGFLILFEEGHSRFGNHVSPFVSVIRVRRYLKTAESPCVPPTSPDLSWQKSEAARGKNRFLPHKLLPLVRLIGEDGEKGEAGYRSRCPETPRRKDPEPCGKNWKNCTTRAARSFSPAPWASRAAATSRRTRSTTPFAASSGSARRPAKDAERDCLDIIIVLRHRAGLFLTSAPKERRLAVIVVRSAGFSPSDKFVVRASAGEVLTKCASPL